jgi:lipopolysaccharide export system protein LptA
MSKTRLLTAVTIGLGLMALPTIGDAQTFQGGQPITWGADRVEYVGSTLNLIGRAELIQGDNRLRADRIGRGRRACSAPTAPARPRSST